MSTPKRIAILKPSALGDIAHALPVLTALRTLYPEAAITWVVNKSFEPLLKDHPHLTETLAFDRAHTHLYAKQPRAGRKLGHITVLDNDPSAALATARQARDALTTAEPTGPANTASGSSPS